MDDAEVCRLQDARRHAPHDIVVSELLLQLLTQLDESRLCQLLAIRQRLLVHELMKFRLQRIQISLDCIYMLIDDADIRVDDTNGLVQCIQPVCNTR